ncbi:hypothetical protein [Catenuloplanes indicus]|uniref:Uncharacterized protein n=1 Tax=Catenuloplanes indicus TaxID=137267 RepID=A0AAE3VUE8_9ACTN|nr:hypothetical protein [Catenuloplanes indicus]MDQ0364026.1 hypothetical protein [Catenuloplanes indicus]
MPGEHLAAVIDDAVMPDPDLLRRLAPALGLRTADLFVIAGQPVPDELGSAWPTSPWDVGAIVRHLVRMDADRRRQLTAVIRSLPVEPRIGPTPDDEYPDTPGALLLRLLRNRNIRPYNARILAEIGDGPHVSDATVAGLGSGRVVVTPQYVTAFAHLLGYPPADMVALTGIGPVVEDARAHPAAAEIAALTWHARQLNSEQLSTVIAAARSMQT